jgi:TolB-like protein/DNA-binding CsgD family transcriptional regulator/Tfp pilus assembly protein PilF
LQEADRSIFVTELAPKPEHLSARERQIAEAYATGRSYRQIAEQLFIAPATVRTHLGTIYRKLGVSSKIDLLRMIGREAIPHIAARPADKVSIGVLPFANLSADPDQEYFSDGITEDLITDLSKLPDIAVIARNSTFAFKDKPFDLVEVGRRLNVLYVVEGSVRRAGNRLRVTAQLVAVATGLHVWGERYDREASDVYAVQDEVTREIVAPLEVHLSAQEAERITSRGTRNLEAFELVLRGRELYYAFNPITNLQAAELFRQAIAIDPNYAEAHAQLGRTFLTAWNLRWNSVAEDTLGQALHWSNEAIMLDPSLAQGHALLSHVHVWTREHARAIAAAEHALTLDPNHADGHAFHAAALCWAGRATEALPAIARAMRLNPIYPGWYLFFYGMAYFESRSYAEAIDGFKRAILRNPGFLPNHFFLAAALGAADWREEAKQEVETIRRLDPALSVDGLLDFLPYRTAQDAAHFADNLRDAGLPP